MGRKYIKSKNVKELLKLKFFLLKKKWITVMHASKINWSTYAISRNIRDPCGGENIETPYANPVRGLRFA